MGECHCAQPLWTEGLSPPVAGNFPAEERGLGPGYTPPSWWMQVCQDPLALTWDNSAALLAGTFMVTALQPNFFLSAYFPPFPSPTDIDPNSTLQYTYHALDSISESASWRTWPVTPGVSVLRVTEMWVEYSGEFIDTYFPMHGSFQFPTVVEDSPKLHNKVPATLMVFTN